jgi:hypothetical protein
MYTHIRKLFCVTVILAGCTGTGTGHYGSGVSGDKADTALTPALRVLAGVTAAGQLETLFHSSSVDQETLVGRVGALLGQNQEVTIKAEGAPLFPGTGPGPQLSQLARVVWSGKVFRFKKADDGTLAVTLTNSILGNNFVNADVRFSKLSDAITARGEDDPAGSLPVLGSEHTLTIDDKVSVILDYANDVSVGAEVFRTIIDEIRPVSADGITAAGITLPSNVDVSNLWLGHATAKLSQSEKRQLVVYFALDFDLNRITASSAQ